MIARELDGAQRAAITHDGQSNFAILAWGDRRDLLVNEIGEYDGAVLVPPDTIVLDITADGGVVRFTPVNGVLSCGQVIMKRSGVAGRPQCEEVSR